MKLFYLWPLVITLIFAGMSEYAAGTFSTIRDYSFSNLDKTTSGIITKSEVEIVGRWGSAGYDIRYEYVIDYKTYSNSQVDYSTKTDFDDKLKKYPLGKKVTVYYDSEKPHYSTLEKKTLGFHIYGHLFALLFCYIFFAWLEKYIQKSEK